MALIRKPGPPIGFRLFCIEDVAQVFGIHPSRNYEDAIYSPPRLAD